MSDNTIRIVQKLKTGIPGFDAISNGGLPKGRTTLLAGTAGSSKTVFAVQFLACGITLSNERCVFVTFEETPDDIRQNMLSFGWDIQKWEDEGKWVFVDVSPKPQDTAICSGDFDLGALLARISHAIKTTRATRISIDSLAAIFNKFEDQQVVRRELLRISVALRQLRVTSLMTAERNTEYGDIARYGIEEFVADNVIILRNVLEEESRRRTMEILKFRGTDHQKGEHAFSVISNGGIVGVPLSTVRLDHNSSNKRVTSGVTRLDTMCGGGFFQDSVVLISGATGTGKTLMATSFISGASEDDRSLFLAYEESRDQLFRNADGWGIDFRQMEDQGKLKVVCAYPESTGLDEHLIHIKAVIDEYKPTRIAIDSLSALERGATAKSFREFVIGLTSYIKSQQIVGVMTSVSPTLLGGTSVTEAHISTVTDTIILLRYVELFGDISRGIAVLKMRGSRHQTDIREYNIDQDGMHVGDPFRKISGILTGHLQYHKASETERFSELFEDV